MKNIIKIWVVSFISAIIPINAWHAYDIFLLNHCDPKLGCMGSFQFSILIYGISAFIIAFAAISAYYLVIMRKNITQLKLSTISTVMISIILSAFMKIYIKYHLGDDTVMFIGGFLLSALLAYIVYQVEINITSKLSRVRKARTLDPSKKRPAAY